MTCFKSGDNRLRGFRSAEGQILPFPIDFDGRPYNTLTLQCERVMLRICCTVCHCAWNKCMQQIELDYMFMLKRVTEERNGSPAQLRR